MFGSRDTIASGASLATGMLLDEFKMLAAIFKALHNLGLDYLLSPLVSTHLVRSKRSNTLRDPSHRRVSSDPERETNPSEVRLALTLLVFHQTLQAWLCHLSLEPQQYGWIHFTADLNVGCYKCPQLLFYAILVFFKFWCFYCLFCCCFCLLPRVISMRWVDINYV